jgi:hypothetical protein
MCSSTSAPNVPIAGPVTWPGGDDFPLPTLGRELSAVLDELERGRGFAVVCHGRTHHEDADGADRDRLLLRLWLATPNSRPLPPSDLAIWGTTEPGVPRGGIAQPA